MAIFMASIDNTIVSTSINEIVNDLGNVNKIGWIFTAYLLSSTATMLIFGKLSDIYGRKKMILFGLGLFIIGSMLCGLSQNMEQLILFRIIQGIGTGALVPIIFILIFELYPDSKDAAKMSGLFGSVYGLATIAGPQIGNVIMNLSEWRWNFYINVPLGVISFILITILLSETKKDKKPKVDYIGTFLLIVVIVSALLVFEWGGDEYVWTSIPIIGLIMGSIISTILFIIVETKVKEPIIPLEIFKNKVVSVSVIIVFLKGILMFAVLTYIPIISSSVLGNENSSLLLTIFMFAIMLGTIVFGFLMHKFSFRIIYVVAMLVGALTTYYLTQIDGETFKWGVIISLALMGFLSIGSVMTVSQNAVVNYVEKKYISIASSMIGFWRSVGAIFGVSILSSYINSNLITFAKNNEHTKDFGKEKINSILNDKTNIENYSNELIEAINGLFGKSVIISFHFVMITCVLGIIIAFFIGNAKFKKRNLNNEE